MDDHELTVFNIIVDKNSFIELFKYGNVKFGGFSPLPDLCCLKKNPYIEYSLCKAWFQLPLISQ